MNTAHPTRHLDLGCGSIPRNPYQRDQVFGVDISTSVISETATIVTANLALQPIPFPSGHFDSVSAYDFIEHMPRVLATNEGSLRFPFIELMNEISRVLRPGGVFYALTPAYPSAEAFVDPTHVNFIARNTHRYFVGTQPLGRMYGFTGSFILRRSQWVVYTDALNPTDKLTPIQHFRHLRHKLKRKLSYIAWEFERSDIG